MFSSVDLEDRIPAKHPLRLIWRIVNDALAGLDGEFAALDCDGGRPLIAPDRPIRARLLQILFPVRSERQLMEQMDDNLMFRWVVALGIDDPVWLATVFTKNRERLLTTGMSRKVMAAILAHPEVKPLLSDAHFLVDGPLIKAWALIKGFQPKAPPEDDEVDGPPPTDQPPQKSQTTPKRPSPHRCKANPAMLRSISRARKKIEEPFGWVKTVGGMAQSVHRGIEKLRARFTMQ